MDGVIADTAPFHLAAWQQTFARRGTVFTAADFTALFGRRNDSIIRQVLGNALPKAEVGPIALEKETAFRGLIGSGVSAFPGVVTLITELAEKGFSQAIASSAPMANIEAVAGSLGLLTYFNAVVWGGEVSEGKPSPKGFLLAAVRLVEEPARCVVIEDAVAGVEAAKRAGMKCIAVTNSHPAGALKKADLVATSLADVHTYDILSLINSA